MSNNGDSVAPRGKWSSKWDYFLSLLGMTVGLGNVWRFPYLCYKNGGGAFLIPYFIMLFLIGVPIFLLETSLGQFTSSTVLKMYEIAPALRGSGICSILVTFIATTYYCVLVAYPLVYLWHTFKNFFWDNNTSLPWATCDNYWNTEQCISHSMDWVEEGNRTDILSTSSSQEFFENRVLQMSSGLSEIGGLVTGVHIANIFVWVVVFLTIFKGVKVIGKVVWFTSIFPFVMLFVLLARGLTLPGAHYGIYIYLVPRWESLFTLQVWADAAIQIFFSLGIGWGSLHCLGSYNKYNNNSLKDAFMIPLVNAFTSFIAGLVAFTVLGFMSFNLSVPIEELAVSGPQLAFVAYPEAIAMMPGATFWAVCFFAMLFFLGIDSCFVQVETVVVSIIDYYPRFRSKKTILTIFVCVVIYLGSLLVCTNSGIYWLRVLDQHAASYGIVFAALTEVVAFVILYGPGFIKRDVEAMLGFNISMYWVLTWLISCPIILFSIFIYWSNVIRLDSLRDGTVENLLGISLGLLPVLGVPLYWWYSVLTAEGRTIPQKLLKAHSVTSSWGPSGEVDRQNWMESKEKDAPTLVYKYLGIGKSQQQDVKMNAI